MITKRRQFLRWGSSIFFTHLPWQSALAGADFQGKSVLSTQTRPSVWRERALIGFGTTLWLRAAHTNADQLESALNDAVKTIRSVEADMCLFSVDSALSRLNRDGVLNKPSVHMLSVLSLSRHVSARSQGAFDVTIQPLWTVWSQAQASDSLPSHKQLQRNVKLVNWRALEVTSDSVRLNIRGMGVSLNGIARGYAADLVRSVLQSHGVTQALIDTDDTATLGNAPDDKPWRFGIESAANVKTQGPAIVADGRGMATSSDAHTTFTPDHLHHHIFNPHNGDSPRYWSSAKVIAPSCAMADALTKVFFMCPPQLIHSTARAWGVDVIMQDKNGNWLNTLPSALS